MRFPSSLAETAAIVAGWEACGGSLFIQLRWISVVTRATIQHQTISRLGTIILNFFQYKYYSLDIPIEGGIGLSGKSKVLLPHYGMSRYPMIPRCSFMPSIDDTLSPVVQGALEDSWLVSALNTLLSHPELLRRVIVSERHLGKGEWLDIQPFSCRLNVSFFV